MDRRIDGVGSLCHPGVATTKPSWKFPIIEITATALCGTITMLLWRWGWNHQADYYLSLERLRLGQFSSLTTLISADMGILHWELASGLTSGKCCGSFLSPAWHEARGPYPMWPALNQAHMSEIFSTYVKVRAGGQEQDDAKKKDPASVGWVNVMKITCFASIPTNCFAVGCYVYAAREMHNVCIFCLLLPVYVFGFASHSNSCA